MTLDPMHAFASNEISLILILLHFELNAFVAFESGNGDSE